MNESIWVNCWKHLVFTSRASVIWRIVLYYYIYILLFRLDTFKVLGVDRIFITTIFINNLLLLFCENSRVNCLRSSFCVFLKKLRSSAKITISIQFIFNFMISGEPLRCYDGHRKWLLMEQGPKHIAITFYIINIFFSNLSKI